MKKLKDWSLIYRIILPFVILVIIFSANIFILNHFLSREKSNIKIIRIANENKSLSRQIILQSELIIKGDEQLKEELKTIKKAYEDSFAILKSGGENDELGIKHTIINDQINSILNSLEDLWIPYKANIDTILVQPLVLTNSIKELVETDSLGNKNFETKKIEIPNPAVQNAIAFIKENSERLNVMHDRLVNEYYKFGKANLYHLKMYYFIFFIVNIIVIILSALIIQRIVIAPIKTLSHVTDAIGQGDLTYEINKESKNEFGIIIASIKRLRNRLKDKVIFVKEISKGNYNAEYELVSESDELGKSLIEMRTSFQHTAEEEKKRKQEDEIQNKLTQGQAQMADILRHDNDNLEELSFNIIKYLINFLNANQGGIFVINDNDTKDVHVELVASIAFNKRKYQKKRFETGEGIIGRCIMEKKTIFMLDLPNNYIEITSGLGKANPKSLLVTPLKFNEEIYGVIEIASFSKFDKHQVEFVEKVAESIASSISSVKISVKTTQLLKESQLQAEKMAKQEDIMRQNMEELKATQSEAKKQEEKLMSFTNSVNHTMIRAEFKPDGTLIYANTRFIEKLEYSGNFEVEGRHITSFIDKKDREWFVDMWEPLSKGGKHFEGNMKHKTKAGNDIWMIATYTAVRNANGEAEKILFLAIDTTDQKKESIDHKGQINSLNESSIKVEFEPSGKIHFLNQLFIEALGYKQIQLEGKTVFELIPKKDLPEFKIIWDKALSNIPYKGEIKLLSVSDDEKWFNCTFTAVKDIYDEIAKIIFIASEITEQKLIEEENKKQNEELKAQEEELRQNLEELAATQEEMLRKHRELEKAKEKVEESEKVLKSALDQAKDKEKEAKEKSQQLEASEEELRQNLEELTATQDEMQRKQEELAVANKQLKQNETILQKAIKKANLVKKETEEKNNQLLSTEEELRQNLEELQTTQEAMRKKQEELEKAKKKLEVNESILKKELIKTKTRQKEINDKNAKLQAAEEELRQNLEELQTTQDEMVRKQEELEKAKKKMEINERILKKELDKSKIKEKQLDDHNTELLATEEELRQNLEELQTTQDEMIRKQKELERAKKQLETNQKIMKKELLKSTNRQKELDKLNKKMADNEEKKRQNIEVLEATQQYLKQEMEKNKEIQQNLKKEKHLLDSFTDNVENIFIFFKDIESKFIRVSKSMLERFGLKDMNEIIGKSDFDFLDEENAKKTYEDEQKIIKTGQPITDLIEKEKWKDGTVKRVLTNKMPLYDDDDNIIGICGFSREMPEQISIKDELEKTKKQVKALQDELKNSKK